MACSGGYVTQPGQIFSARGECRPFDINADGTVPSDAVVAVVLKRVPDVLDEGASAYAVISGTAVGSDGATQKAGYQVPSPRGQAEVIKEAWNNSGISMDKLAYVEYVSQACLVCSPLTWIGYMGVERLLATPWS